MGIKWFRGPEKILTIVFLGFFLATLAVLIIGTTAFFLYVADPLRDYVFQITLGMGIAGFLLLAWGYLKHKYGKTPPPETSQESPLAFFRRPEYWGTILVLIALPIFFFCKKPPEEVVRKKAPAPPSERIRKPVVEPIIEPVVEPPSPVEFPPLVLKGLVLNGPDSTAVINGETVRLRSVISNYVMVISIEAEGVTVEMKGERRLLTVD